MNRAFLIFISLVMCFFSSCISIQKGSITQNSFSVKNNFEIVKTIEGNSKATYILGIGGNLPNGLINEAKKNMYSNNKLQPNQNLTNITTDVKTTFFIFPLLYSRQSVFISADVIQFNDDKDFSRNKTSNNFKDSESAGLIESKGNERNVSIVNSKEELEIISILNVKNKIIEKYGAIDEVKIGDIVRYMDINNEYVFGVVYEVKGNKVKIKTYPFRGQELIIEDEYYRFKKVTVK